MYLGVIAGGFLASQLPAPPAVFYYSQHAGSCWWKAAVITESGLIDDRWGLKR